MGRPFTLPAEVVLSANARGFIRLRTAEVARAAGVSEPTVRVWMREPEKVSEQTDAAIRRVLGVERAA